MFESGDFAMAVSRLYQGWLGREPDPDGLAYWVEQLESGSMTFARVSAEIGNSPEAILYRDDRDQERPADFIRSAYAEILYRRPDEAGFNYWTNAISSGESSYRDVVRQIRDSEEAQNKAVMEEIAGLYHAFLDRRVDAEGLSFWLNAYKSGEMTAAQIAATLRNSQEGLLATPTTLSSSQLIEYLYLRLYSREVDADSKSQLVARLDAGEAFSDIALELATYVNVVDTSDRESLRARNVKDYMLIRDEFRSLTYGESTDKDDVLVFAVVPESDSPVMSFASVASASVIYGTEGPDRLVGTGSEVIYGLGGDDTIEGGNGTNALYGGNGNDTIYGGPGLDSEIRGEAGDDLIYAQAGNARVIGGGTGDDIIYVGRNGFSGGARIYGNEGRDLFHYSVSDWNHNQDTVDGGGGWDWLVLSEIDADFSFYADRLNVSGVQLFGNNWQSSYTMYINPGVWIAEIRGLDIGYGPDMMEVKILPYSTPFDSAPVAEYQNWKKADYRHGSGPVDLVKEAGDWFSYRDVGGNGYMTYFDESNGIAQTILLVDTALGGSVTNGVLYIG
jgi:hypothetical protein